MLLTKVESADGFDSPRGSSHQWPDGVEASACMMHFVIAKLYACLRRLCCKQSICTLNNTNLKAHFGNRTRNKGRNCGGVIGRYYICLHIVLAKSILKNCFLALQVF